MMTFKRAAQRARRLQTLVTHPIRQEGTADGRYRFIILAQLGGYEYDVVGFSVKTLSSAARLRRYLLTKEA